MVMHGRGFHMRHSAWKAPTPATLLAQMPSGVTGLWTMDKYVTSPRPTVVNQAAATAVSQNLLTFGRGQFKSVSSPVGTSNITNATVTDGVTSPYDSTANASTVVWGSVDGFIVFYMPASGVTPSTQVTLSFDIATTDASTVSFRTGLSTSMVTKSATPTFTRMSTTFNVSNSSQIFIARSLNTTTPANLIIDNVTLHLGAADLGRDILAGHMMLGKFTSYDVLPSYAGGILDFSAATAEGIIQFLNPLTLNLATVIMVGKRASTALRGSISPFMSSIGNPGYQQFMMQLDSSGGSNSSDVTHNFAGTQGVSSDYHNLAWTDAGSLHAITVRHDGTNASLFVDDVMLASAASTGTPSQAAFGINSPYFGTPGNGKYAAAALYNRALSDAEVKTAYAALKAYVEPIVGATVSPQSIMLVEGDSITGSFATAYPIAGAFSLGGRFGRIVAVGGAVSGTSADTAGTNSLWGRKAAVLGMIPANKAGRKVVLSIFIGANDYAVWNGNVSGWAANLSSYIAAMRAGGVDKVVLCTLTPQTTANFNTFRNACNAIIKGGGWIAANGVDVLADFAGDATMGIDGNGTTTGPWNTTYYTDGIHPTTAGQALLAPIWTTALTSVA